MSFEAILSELDLSGVRLAVCGKRLRWSAPRGVMTPERIAVVKRHKAEIIDLLGVRGVQSDLHDAEAWQAFYRDHRKRALQVDRLPPAQAENRARECCMAEWMSRLPSISEPGRCAWCGAWEATGSIVLPFGSKSHGHTWLHGDCWNDWHRSRRREALQALREMDIFEGGERGQSRTVASGGSAKLPRDFGKTGSS